MSFAVDNKIYTIKESGPPEVFYTPEPPLMVRCGSNNQPFWHVRGAVYSLHGMVYTQPTPLVDMVCIRSCITLDERGVVTYYPHDSFTRSGGDGVMVPGEYSSISGREVTGQGESYIAVRTDNSLVRVVYDAHLGQATANEVGYMPRNGGIYGYWTPNDVRLITWYGNQVTINRHFRTTTHITRYPVLQCITYGGRELIVLENGDVMLHSHSGILEPAINYQVSAIASYTNIRYITPLLVDRVGNVREVGSNDIKLRLQDDYTTNLDLAPELEIQPVKSARK